MAKEELEEKFERIKEEWRSSLEAGTEFHGKHTNINELIFSTEMNLKKEESNPESVYSEIAHFLDEKVLPPSYGKFEEKVVKGVNNIVEEADLNPEAYPNYLELIENKYRYLSREDGRSHNQSQKQSKLF